MSQRLGSITHSNEYLESWQSSLLLHSSSYLILIVLMLLIHNNILNILYNFVSFLLFYLKIQMAPQIFGVDIHDECVAYNNR